MLADEDAADGDHEGPEEYPCGIDLSPADGSCCLAAACLDEPSAVESKSEGCAGGKTEGIGCMGGEETEAAAGFFQHIQSVFQHEFIIQRSYSADKILDEVGELVAESECRCSSQSDDQTAFPAETPDEHGYNEYVHRDPHRNL